MSRTEAALYSMTRGMLKSVAPLRFDHATSGPVNHARRGETGVGYHSARVLFPRILHDSTFRTGCPHYASGKAICFRSG